MEWKPIKKEIIDAATGAVGGRENLSVKINRSKRQIGEYRSLERAPVDIAMAIENVVKSMAKELETTNG